MHPLSGIRRTASAFLTAALLMGLVECEAGDVDPAKVIGTKDANCKQCHPSESAHWEKTSHFNSLDRLQYSGNGKKYADALKISSEEIATTSLCVDCHGTKKEVSGVATAISGVSCESCHGGAKDWLEPHGQYHDGAEFSTLAALRDGRSTESAEHRQQRLATTAAAGMIRPEMLHMLATNCLSCHIIDNDKLVAAGHKAASNFELSSWLNGEVRHNFLLDAETNAAAPSLWMTNHDATAEQRNRLKFVVGALTKTEMVLRSRAKSTNPSVVPQLGGIVAAGNGSLAQINAMAGTPQTQAVAAQIAPLLGTIFVAMPTDETTYRNIADAIRTQTTALIESEDGSGLAGLDGLLKSLPPHYSQNFKK